MAYDYRYINKQIFKSSVCYTLILEDIDSQQLIRIEKSFKIDNNLIDEEFLRLEAKKEIALLLNPPPAIIEEVPPEEAE